VREPTYFILAALKDEPGHGYAIITRVTDLSGGRIKLATGTLYQALDRLTKEAFIEVVLEEVVNGRARRHYALTPGGRAALQAEAARMAAAARVVLNPRPAAGPA
jgi:PadR family transcriptional regulator, regulatory protein PadR